VEELDRIKEVLEDIRAILQADGGDLEFLGYEEGIVKLRLMGACGACPFSQMTLKMGIERILKEKVPGIKEVEAV
jgi:Fe-S cluster biogenesis protein NfuA